MDGTPLDKVISVAQLRLDTQNPRLPGIQDDQRGTIRSMIEAQQTKIVALARHIVNNGPNPASLLIVMPSEQGKEVYDVLDGNRRVAALKLLEDPSIAEGILSDNVVNRLRTLSARFSSNPVTELSCVVVADREEADTWIPLIHRGEQKGAGLVEWDGQVAARYDARKGKRSVALQVLGFVAERAALSEATRTRVETGRFPITSLSRLLNTPYVRSKLGIKKDAGNVLTYHPDDEVLKGLTRVVEDLGGNRITVSDIKREKDRIDYINGLDPSELPDPSTWMDIPAPLGAAEGKDKVDVGAKAPGMRRAAVRRSTLIPKSCVLSISQSKINMLYDELQRLRLDQFPNAGAVLFRVFLELSLDHYAEHILRWGPDQRRNSSLAHKLTAVAKHLRAKGAMTESQIRPIKKAAGGQTLLASSVNTMHEYVHSRYFSPVASELTVGWDDLQPFVEHVWSELQGVG